MGIKIYMYFCRISLEDTDDMADSKEEKLELGYLGAGAGERHFTVYLLVSFEF